MSHAARPLLSRHSNHNGRAALHQRRINVKDVDSTLMKRRAPIVKGFRQRGICLLESALHTQFSRKNVDYNIGFTIGAIIHRLAVISMKLKDILQRVSNPLGAHDVVATLNRRQSCSSCAQRVRL